MTAAVPGRPTGRTTSGRTGPSSGTSRSSSGEWARRLRVGDRVSDYVLERELGEGGMGSVFVARHTTTRQEVALKVMLVDPDVNAGALERFRREGQAQAVAGQHPNVLRVHTAGEQNGCASLVMELARGGDLKARLEQGPLDPRDAAALIAGLARGLAHVHAHGVLHRDLKPGNVVFDDGTPKLMDFGLARLAGSDKLTQTGTLLGTPAYMAPEQAGGEALDERADVYGLGAVLYHCLTGRAPFAGDSRYVVVRKVLTEKPTPPRELRPEVPTSLEQLTLRALAKDAGKRFATAKALADDLDAFVEGNPGWLSAPFGNTFRGGERDGFLSIAPVGSFERGRSPFGMYDMFGNVWEFVAKVPSADGVDRMFSYGSGWSNKYDFTIRDYAVEQPGVRKANNGIRVVADVDPPP